MIYGYLRVSTEKQNLENQDYELKNLLKRIIVKLIKLFKKRSLVQSAIKTET